MLELAGLVYWVIVFFFQAEDGIRDLVRSRGLGDVYKRQGKSQTITNIAAELMAQGKRVLFVAEKRVAREVVPVSYTHLTLPTSDLV